MPNHIKYFLIDKFGVYQIPDMQHFDSCGVVSHCFHEYSLTPRFVYATGLVVSTFTRRSISIMFRFSVDVITMMTFHPRHPRHHRQCLDIY
jgi:hypothetical protein